MRDKYCIGCNGIDDIESCHYCGDEIELISYHHLPDFDVPDPKDLEKLNRVQQIVANQKLSMTGTDEEIAQRCWWLRVTLMKLVFSQDR